ncbi:MAG TPA: hypothetical protein VJ045_07285 [Hyphomicrobiaceae bacterium]|nr:hypothetical protein [Hyphomicrobiaceae bacterium]
MDVLTRNGEATVKKGWQVLLIGAVIIVLVASLKLGIAFTIATPLLFAVPLAGAIELNHGLPWCDERLGGTHVR